MIDDWTSVFSRVKGALRRRGRSEQDADDLVQEAFLRLTCYARDQAVEKPEAFLTKTALNLSIDAHRARASRGEEVLLEDLKLRKVPLVFVDVGPQRSLVSNIRIDYLHGIFIDYYEEYGAFFFELTVW